MVLSKKKQQSDTLMPFSTAVYMRPPNACKGIALMARARVGRDVLLVG